MSTTLLPIAGLQPTANTATLLYTVPSITVATVFQLLVLNTDTSVASAYTIWRIPSGGTAPSSAVDQPQHMLVVAQPIIALERHSIPDRVVLAAGDTLYVLATTATVTFSGSVLQQA
jgi:hypothetical protein